MRITCPGCGRSNRAKRKTCGSCHEPLAHLRPPVEPPPPRAPVRWPPNGTRVGVIRSAHGWYDGDLAGVLVAPGVVRGDDGYVYEINHPRDLT